MYRYFFRFVVMTLTILTVNLITNAITNYMVSYKNHYKPVAFTLLGMALTVVILYPLFIKLESWVKRYFSKSYQIGKVSRRKIPGIIIYLPQLLLWYLFYFYAKMWYHIDFFKSLFH